MIIAMSRFRIKNDREQDAHQAFVKRPRLVGGQAGFMDLEVFQDAKERAAFHLITRWRDDASFRAWHSNEAHQRSHTLMPKGRGLNSAFTELRFLERVKGGHDWECFDHFPGD
jgi:heme-degrading monooxygenase HmoA